MTSHLRSAVGTAVSAVLLGSAVLVASSVSSRPAKAAAPAGACKHRSLNHEINRANVVFRGVVDKAGRVHGKGTGRTRVYRVTADRVYQGSLVADKVRVTAEVGVKCPPPTLAQSKRYIFFVTEDGSRLVSTSATARASHKLTDQVVAKLGDGEQPHPTPPAKPTFTKVANAAPPRLSRLLAPGAAVVVLSLLGLVVIGRLSRRPT
jgi:hypothetical protein